MNRALAETLTLLNGLIAVVIVAGGLFLGYRVAGGFGFAFIVGGVAGLIVAALACGTLAYLALIERHLARIAGSPRENRHESQTRRDPTL